MAMTREELTKIENRLGWSGSPTWPVPQHVRLWARKAEQLINERDALRVALKDAISCFGQKPDILVTEERIEAWERVL